jgi:hypothetical protein
MKPIDDITVFKLRGIAAGCLKYYTYGFDYTFTEKFPAIVWKGGRRNIIDQNITLI